MDFRPWLKKKKKTIVKVAQAGTMLIHKQSYGKFFPNTFEALLASGLPVKSM